jgi:membrane protease YdiL (CAAX protease family)
MLANLTRGSQRLHSTTGRGSRRWNTCEPVYVKGLQVAHQESGLQDVNKAVFCHSPASKRNAILRSSAFWVGFFVCLFLTRFLIGSLGGSLTAGRDTRARWYGGVLMTVLSLALTRICARMDKGCVVNTGTKLVSGSIPRASLGVVCILPLAALSIVSLGWLVPGVRFIRADRGILPVLSAAALFLVLAAFEEISFRGYPMRRLLQSFGVWLTLLFVAPVFVFYHIFLGWQLLPALIGTGTGSLLFGMAAVAARKGLAFPIGVHAGWNFMTWCLGVGATGIWKMTFPSALTGRVQVVGMCAYVMCMLFGTMLLWFWSRRGKKSG